MTKLLRSTDKPIFVLCLLWLATTCAGSISLLNYVTTPGESAPSDEYWIASKSLELASPLATLVMVVHPQCPCTQASIDELAIVMARCHSKLKAYVLFVRPSNLPQGQTELWRRTNQIPGVSAMVDESGSLSRQFRAATSGQCYLYDAKGHLLFSGGITSGRGHEGDNVGLDSVVACVSGNRSTPHSTPVFGCPIFNAESDN